MLLVSVTITIIQYYFIKTYFLKRDILSNMLIHVAVNTFCTFISSKVNAVFVYLLKAVRSSSAATISLTVMPKCTLRTFQLQFCIRLTQLNSCRCPPTICRKRNDLKVIYSPFTQIFRFLLKANVFHLFLCKSR